MRLIRETMPLIMLGCVLICSLLSYFDVYFFLYDYLSNIVGYSIATNLFMMSVYFNGRYCLSIKISVISLILLNLLNIAHIYFKFDSYYVIFDLWLTVLMSIIVFTLLIFKKSSRRWKK